MYSDSGVFRNDNRHLYKMDHDFSRKIYKGMMMLPAMDNILYNVQRQGKISFYVCPQLVLSETLALTALLDDFG